MPFQAFAQITVTAPAANETLRAADDYASRTFQDQWDMNQWTDLGWFTFGTDNGSNINNIAFSNGIFSATTITSDPSVWFLDPNATTTPLGRDGVHFPIDSTKYRRFMIRMNLSGGGVTTPPSQAQQGQLIWNIYSSPPSQSGGFFTYPGWWIYSIDIPSLGVATGATWSSASVPELRFDPLNMSGVNIQIDWARLTEEDASLHRTITWTGSGAVDIYLDNDTNFANGYVGQVAAGKSGNSMDFYVGALPAGTYYVAIRPANTSGNPSYSAGAWTVNDIPTLTFTSPNPEGSADDFATVQLNNAWDMNALSDVDQTFNVTGSNITNIAARDEAGNSLGTVRVLSGTTSGDFGDPEVYVLHPGVRGTTYHIDSNRYRILALKWGMAQTRNLNSGSIGRVIWRTVGDTVENVSNDIALYTLPNANVMQTVIADMKTMPIEPTSPSHSGWNGMVDGFRVDPDEFSFPLNFYIQSVKLSAFERANASYVINWMYANQGTVSPTLQLFYDATGSGFAGTQIASGLNPATGTYTWNTSGIGNGTYYIYARIMNGSTVMNQTYARWPIVIDHSSQQLPTISLDRSNLYFGATNNGAVSTAGQVVHVTTAPGVSWSASSSQGFFSVNPPSGVGSGSFTVSVSSSALPSPSNLNGVITVTASGVSNSPQFVNAFVNVVNPANVGSPFGSFDTPVNGTTGIAGAVPVTGWALDKIEVTSVDISRNAVCNEPPGPNGLIFIGNGSFVEGARPDVAAANSSTALNSRAGWGYLLLTNFLPNTACSGALGNGTYTLHATAHSKTGQTTDLGTRTITVDNAHASKPFGTIDTPGQGGSASGNQFVNFGWALTPQPQCVPIDGSTITVTVDGVTLGHPVYNQNRSDIAGAFPSYCNSNGAVGYYILNTTQLTNGVHTIGWVVYDNIGRGDGIGSRFFTVINGGGEAAPEETEVEYSPTVTVRQGFDLDREPEPLAPNGPGSYSVDLEELGRVELHIGATRGREVIDGQARPLPAGSTLKGGIFYWNPGPGFLGAHDLEFDRADGATARVRFQIRPKTFSRTRVSSAAAR